MLYCYDLYFFELMVRMIRYRCMYCNNELDKISREHIIPNVQYGSFIFSKIL